MTFNEYYQYYLSLHQNKWCRRIHVLGNIATLVYIGAVVYFGVWLLLLLVPFVVYPFAWSGHFFFEKNKPAAWSNPLKAKACDWKMMWDMLRGKIKW
jgi:hypothetical protein|tara:strand:+ start:312 stop:602 length:291 start_codon:yes stop_codon:yes gene_type:complete